MAWPARCPALVLRVHAVALLLAVLAAPAARAVATLDVVFTERNGAPIVPTAVVEAAAGDELIATLVLGAGPEGISSYGVSILFDEDLGDELDLLSADEFLPAGFDFNLDPGVGSTQESDGSQRGEVLTFEAATFGFGPADAFFEVGQVRFRVTGNVATDGPDVFAGLFNPGLDAVFDNLGGLVSVTSRDAAVNVPEPATGLLLALGLLGLSGLPRGRAGA